MGGPAVLQRLSRVARSHRRTDPAATPVRPDPGSVTGMARRLAHLGDVLLLYRLERSRHEAERLHDVVERRIITGPSEPRGEQDTVSRRALDQQIDELPNGDRARRRLR